MGNQYCTYEQASALVCDETSTYPVGIVALRELTRLMFSLPKAVDIRDLKLLHALSEVFAEAAA
jgi:hypothetical protein